MKTNIILSILIFILFWLGYYVGITQHKRNYEREIKAEVKQINTSNFKQLDSLYLGDNGSLTTEKKDSCIAVIENDSIHILKTGYYTIKFGTK